MNMHSRQFWIDYLENGTDFTGLPSIMKEIVHDFDRPPQTISIEFQNRFRLEIRLDWDGHHLWLMDGETGASAELGWMNGHQMSDAFRFEELEPVCTASSMRPLWQVQLLLCQYITPTPDSVDACVAIFESALRASELFSAEEAQGIAGYLKRVTREHFQWIRDDSRGWVGVIAGPDAQPWEFPYTLRTMENEEFDFALFSKFIEYCEGHSRAN
jgi:hypothetical protein